MQHLGQDRKRQYEDSNEVGSDVDSRHYVSGPSEPFGLGIWNARGVF